MTTCVYVNGVISSDSRVTSGNRINNVNYKKTYSIKGTFQGENIIGICIAGNAMKKNNLIRWLEDGSKPEKYNRILDRGIQALILTDVGVWLFQDGDFLEAWEGCSIGSGGEWATAKYNLTKCCAQDAVLAATSEESGDTFSGGMIQWISRTSKGTTDMPTTVLPDVVDKYTVKWD